MTGPTSSPPVEPAPEPVAPEPAAPAQPAAPAGVPAGGYAVPQQAHPGYPHPGYAPPPGYPRPVYLQPPPLAPNGQPLADFFSRLGAYLIDGLIMGAISTAFAIPLLIWWVYAFVSEVTTLQTSADGTVEVDGSEFTSLIWGYLAIFGALLIVNLIISYLYLVEFTWRSGQTIGKKVVKLKIVPVDPATERTRGMLAKRWLVEHGAALVPGFSYVDGLWQLWDKPLQQCLHDKAARTVVVKIG
ncbi:putative RDD family membrane protein YckC [Hamadaea flava]|uniref:RDD family protein n=1 Tax=Hamadaea flava TaxID=1742688 RepID=A0ABV8LZG6_9ACTN|nr:RDD family protein [Hamadaea flava]MCP2325807.1 putative RDD family membrane protein YckC [Hamadaea flava]